MVENYNGNEEVEEATVLKFKKGEREMLNILHIHILSIGFIFTFLGFISLNIFIGDEFALSSL